MEAKREEGQTMVQGDMVFAWHVAILDLVSYGLPSAESEGILE